MTTHKPFVASPQQAAFFDWIDKGSGSALLEASAGAGKTTTLVRGLQRMDGSIFVGAFNKKIAQEIENKAREQHAIRPGIFISTLHARGFGALRRRFDSLKVEESKVRVIVEELVEIEPEMMAVRAYVPFITKLVSFAKQYLIGITCPFDDVDKWRELVDHFSLDEELPDNIDLEQPIQHAITTLQYSNRIMEVAVDFDDMLYGTLLIDARMYSNDWVVLDEVQDCSPARIEIARRSLAPGGRFVGAGDERQSIYGFAGADVDAIKRVVETFGCTRLPLTVTYRCPKAVVQHAHQWVPEDHIIAHPSAPDGAVREVQWNPTLLAKGNVKLPWFVQDAPAKTDAVLCRNTKPLVSTAFAMIRHGVPCKVEGRDIGKNLIALAERWKVKTVDALDARLEIYLQREVKKAQQNKSEKREQDVRDRVETLRVFMDRCRARGEHNISCVVSEINTLFADDVSDMVTLCTGHRSKGREWPTVWWLQTAGFKKPLQPWEQLAEDNVSYVTCTRAQQTLVIVPANCVEAATKKD